MKLNARELRSLRLLREQRETPPTFRRAVQRNSGIYLVLLIAFAASAWLMWSGAIEPLGTLFAGFFLGILLRDRTWIGMALRAWPLRARHSASNRRRSTS